MRIDEWWVGYDEIVIAFLATARWHLRWVGYGVYCGVWSMVGIISMWRFCGTATFLGLASPYLASVFYLWLA